MWAFRWHHLGEMERVSLFSPSSRIIGTRGYSVHLSARVLSCKMIYLTSRNGIWFIRVYLSPSGQVSRHAYISSFAYPPSHKIRRQICLLLSSPYTCYLSCCQLSVSSVVVLLFRQEGKNVWWHAWLIYQTYTYEALNSRSRIFSYSCCLWFLSLSLSLVSVCDSYSEDKLGGVVECVFGCKYNTIILNTAMKVQFGRAPIGPRVQMEFRNAKAL